MQQSIGMHIRRPFRIRTRPFLGPVLAAAILSLPAISPAQLIVFGRVPPYTRRVAKHAGAAYSQAHRHPVSLGAVRQRVPAFSLGHAACLWRPAANRSLLSGCQHSLSVQPQSSGARRRYCCHPGRLLDSDEICADPWLPVPTHGFPLLDRDANWVAYLDRRIFPGRLYNGSYDPEGLLSDLPSLATTLLGVLTGLWLKTKRSAACIATGLFAASVAAFALGMIWNIWFPINKQLWTSSYVLLAAGWTLLPLCICYILVEIGKWNRGWTYPWLVFGSNAIVAYVFSELLASTLFSIHMQYNGTVTTLQEVIYQKYFFSLGNPSFGSLLYSLAYTLFCMLPVAVLYRKRIFVKI